MDQQKTNFNQHLTNNTENVIYFLIAILVLMGSLFSMMSSYGEINWIRICIDWVRLTPFIIIFFINNSILSPHLLLKKRLGYYLLAVTILIALVVMVSPNMRYIMDWLMECLDGNRLTRRPMKARSDLLGERAMMSILVVGINNTIKLLIQRQKEDKQHEENKKLLLQTELSFLRNQISPHFFMNTLNNIHALIALDPDKAGKSVIQLSALMRHMLSEANRECATIKDEFEFLNSYINLMKLRCSKRVKIEVNFDLMSSERSIPSFLFVSIVENAFKYGVDYTKPSSITISASIVGDHLHFNCQNSKSNQETTEQNTGIGLDNLRKQLNLLFKTDYLLEILDQNDRFCVTLEIPLKND